MRIKQELGKHNNIEECLGLKHMVGTALLLIALS